MESVLQVRQLTKHFGGLNALSRVSLKAEAGRIIGIIGPNGAGKTTLFNCLTGLYDLTDGQIIFEDRSIAPEASEEKRRTILKISWVFLVSSLIWAPLFWAYCFPKTWFKVEITILALLLLAFRGLVFRGLRQFQVWSWSVLFAVIPADIFYAVVWLKDFRELGLIPGTRIPMAYFSFPWSGFAVFFGLFFLWILLSPETRQLYGFRYGPDAICRFGISRTFQNIRLFQNLSVLDNVKIGAHIRIDAGIAGSLFRPPAQKEEEARIEKDALEKLKFVDLFHRIGDLAGALAYGEQRRLEIARALASNPRLLLLDEPAAGMNARESARLIQLIRKIREDGVTILIIEHDMKVMMTLADYIYVLDHGELIAEGEPDEIRKNPKVIEAYLGGAPTC